MLILCISLYSCFIRLWRLRFLSCRLSLYLFWICFHVFKGIGFSLHNYITYISFIFAFGNSLWYVFPECERGEYFFNIFRLSLAFNDFCYCCTPYIIDSPSSINRRQQSSPESNQTHVTQWRVTPLVKSADSHYLTGLSASYQRTTD